MIPIPYNLLSLPPTSPPACSALPPSHRSQIEIRMALADQERALIAANESRIAQIVRAQEQHFAETIVRRERELSDGFRAKLEEQERVFVVAAAQRDEAKRVRDFVWGGTCLVLQL